MISKPHSQEVTTSDFDFEGEGSNPSEAATFYLIAHKVRGEPAFDIAIRTEIAGEEAWIIPTSGHRAYPWWSHPLNFELFRLNVMDFLFDMPANWPDHYSAKAAKEPKPSRGGRQLLTQLGLGGPSGTPMTGNLTRRV